MNLHQIVKIDYLGSMNLKNTEKSVSTVAKAVRANWWWWHLFQ